MSSFHSTSTRIAIYILSLCNNDCFQAPSNIANWMFIFLTITFFKTFCHLSMMCVIYSDLKFVSQRKNGINSSKFSCNDFYGFWRGLSRQECIDQLICTFGHEAPWFASVKSWYNEFHRHCRSLTDESREGHSKSVVVPENIEAVRKLIL